MGHSIYENSVQRSKIACPPKELIMDPSIQEDSVQRSKIACPSKDSIMGHSIQENSVQGSKHACPSKKLSRKKDPLRKKRSQPSKPNVKETNYYLLFVISIMKLLNTILSKNIVWSFFILIAVKGMFSQGASVPNLNIQFEANRPQVNLTTLLSRGNNGFIIHPHGQYSSAILTQLVEEILPHIQHKKKHPHGQ